jgi:hypothetical protein
MDTLAYPDIQPAVAPLYILSSFVRILRISSDSRGNDGQAAMASSWTNLSITHKKMRA